MPPFQGMVLLLAPVSAPPSVGAPSRPPDACTDASEASTPGSAASARRPASKASLASLASLALLEHPRPTLADMGSSVQPIARSIFNVVMVGSGASRTSACANVSPRDALGWGRHHPPARVRERLTTTCTGSRHRSAGAPSRPGRGTAMGRARTGAVPASPSRGDHRRRRAAGRRLRVSFAHGRRAPALGLAPRRRHVSCMREGHG